MTYLLLILIVIFYAMGSIPFNTFLALILMWIGLELIEIGVRIIRKRKSLEKYKQFKS